MTKSLTVDTGLCVPIEEDEEETPVLSHTESDYHPDSAFFESNGFEFH